MTDDRHDRLEKKLDKIDEKTDKLDARLDRIDIHMAVYNEQLKIHIEGVKQVREENKATDAKVAPLQKKAHYVEGTIKILGSIAAVCGIIKLVASILAKL